MWRRRRGGRVASAWLGVAGACALAACGAPDPPEPRAAGPAARSGELAVVSLSAAASALVVDLGAGPALIAVDRESAQLPGLAGLPVVALSDAPALQPDLVLVPALGADAAPLVERLRADGADLVEVAPRDYDEVFALSRALGARLADPVRAAAFEGRIGRELGALAALSRGQRRPRVAAVSSLEPFELAPAHSFATDLIELAGGTSTTHEHVQPPRAASPAELAATAPDLVLVLSPDPLPEPARADARDAFGPEVVVEFFVLDTERFWVRDGAEAVHRLRALLDRLPD